MSGVGLGTCALIVLGFGLAMQIESGRGPLLLKNLWGNNLKRNRIGTPLADRKVLNYELQKGPLHVVRHSQLSIVIVHASILVDSLELMERCRKGRGAI